MDPQEQEFINNLIGKIVRIDDEIVGRLMIATPRVFIIERTMISHFGAADILKTVMIDRGPGTTLTKFEGVL